MVEANVDADGVRRAVQYGIFRTDKQPDPGFSADLVHNEIPADCYDDFNKLPILNTPYKSILDVFLR